MASAFVSFALALGTTGIATAETSHHGHGSARDLHSNHQNGQRVRGKGTIIALGTNAVTVDSHHGTPNVGTPTATATSFLGKTASTVAALSIG